MKRMDNMSDPENYSLSRLHSASELPLEKKLYFNGFTVALSPIDCSIVLQHNDQTIALISTSHSIAKTLVSQLDSLLSDFEHKTGNVILKLDEINDLLSKG